MAEEQKKLFKVTIDNITIEVEPGTSILNAARKIGGDIVPPAMCYYTIPDPCPNSWLVAVPM